MITKYELIDHTCHWKLEHPSNLNPSIQISLNRKEAYRTVGFCLIVVRQSYETIRLINTIEDSTYLEGDIVIFDA